MGTKTKIAIAGAFVGVVAMGAAAFGQSGSGGSSATPSATSAPKDRRAARMDSRAADRCARVAARSARRAARLVHRESKLKAPAGFATVTADQGDITAIDHSAKQVTIRRLDDETVTATATDRTYVCKDGTIVPFDSLKVGDHARLVQVRSERFTGLRLILALSPQAAASQPASPSDFSGDGLGDLSGEVF
jgi:hypothetical protein